MVAISRALLGGMPFSTSCFSCSTVPWWTKLLSETSSDAIFTALVMSLSRESAMSRNCPLTCTTTLILGRPNCRAGMRRSVAMRPSLSRTGSTPSIHSACATVAPCVAMNSPAHSV